MLAAVALEVAVFVNRSADRPRIGQPADRTAMIDFEGVKGRGVDTEPLCRRFWSGRFMTEGFR